MSTSTVYDVKVRYSVDNRAGRAVDGLVDNTRSLRREVGLTTGMLGRLGAAAVAAFGARAAGKALIGFNSTVEDTRLQIAGMLALARKRDLATQFGDADRVFANLQKRAMSLPGTTMEYARMAGAITQPIIDAGLTLKDLEDLTVNSVVGAKALGIAWEVAARDIDQALRGQFHSVDVFSGKLLGSIGYKGEEGRSKFNAMSAQKRAGELKRALMQPQMEQLAAAQGQSFSGVMSTLQDSLEQVLGKVGLPLFQAITKEVQGWNKWLDNNKRTVAEIATSVGQGLVKGFGYVKDAIAFLVQHADTLLTIGKVWLAVKVGGMVGGAITKAGAGAGGMIGRLREWGAAPSYGVAGHGAFAGGAGRQAIGGAKGLIGNAGLLGQAALVGYSLGEALGLSKFGSEIGTRIAIWRGNIDSNYLAWQRLQKASKELSDAMDKAADSALKTASPDSAKASRIVTNMQGMADLKQQASQILADKEREVRRVIGDRMGGTSSIPIDYVRKKGGEQIASMVETRAREMGLPVNQFIPIKDVDRFLATMARDAELQAEQAKMTPAIAENTWQKLLPQLSEYQQQTIDKQAAMLDLTREIVTQLKPAGVWNAALLNYAPILDIMKRATQDPTGKFTPVAEKPKVNVTIQRIEVQSEDPDRFAFGLVESFRQAAKNPSSALAVLREG